MTIMLRLIVYVMVMVGFAMAGPEGKKVVWTEYELWMHVADGRQPVVTIRWFADGRSGSYQEYAEVWRKGMKFGYGERFLSETLTGCNDDGKKKVGKVVELTFLDTVTTKRWTFRSDDPKRTTGRSYSPEWLKAHNAKLAEKAKSPQRSEYWMSVGFQDGKQPYVTIRWTFVGNGAWGQEYAQVWRKGMTFGKEKRFVSEKISGCDDDGKKKVGEVAELVILDTVTKAQRTFRSDDPKLTYWKNSSEEWLKAWEAKEVEKRGGREAGD